jgi:hypothetical protein
LAKKLTPTQKEDSKMNYIGVDCHISALDFAVVTKTGRIKNKARVKQA